ncbi:Sec-independent protein translocase protein TatA [Alphaproteobacteria bacterium SO-S41]|nr:Sec-independent protein translocase protein TatA [Alphaproteobacteria bacterium SO-S41]
MGSFSIWHLIVIVVLVMVLFGRGKISELMGDVAKGVKNFRQGMADDPKPQVTSQAETPVVEPVKTDASKV